LIRVSCLVIALVVLAGALTVAALNGSPYETLKQSLLRALTYRNVTLQGGATVSVNGTVLQSSRMHEVSADNGQISYSFDNQGNPSSVYYYAPGLNLYPNYLTEDGTQWYSASISPADEYYPRSGGFGRQFGIDEEDLGTAQARFIELLVDAMVGDLKNNVTMTTDDSGIRHIGGTVTESQLPELVRAGLDMAVEQNNNGGNRYRQREISFDPATGERVWEEIEIYDRQITTRTFAQTVRPMTAEEHDALNSGKHSLVDAGHGWVYLNDTEHINLDAQRQIGETTRPAERLDYDPDPSIGDPITAVPLQSLTLDYLHGEADVDPSGNLLAVNGNATVTILDIFGVVSTLEFNVDLSFSDINATSVSCPIPGADTLLTSNYALSRFGDEYAHVYFTLNPDGTVNESSVTSTSPHETYKDEIANFQFSSPSSIGIIGGADGPTSVLVTTGDGESQTFEVAPGAPATEAVPAPDGMEYAE
jgi:hypothetical protein